MDVIGGDDDAGGGGGCLRGLAEPFDGGLLLRPFALALGFTFDGPGVAGAKLSMSPSSASMVGSVFG